MFVLMLTFVNGQLYNVTTIEECVGDITVKFYFDGKYNIPNCEKMGDFYICDCKNNFNLQVNAEVKKEYKLVVEYYTKEFNNPIYKFTKEFFIKPFEKEPIIKYKMSDEEKSAMSKTLLITVIITICIFIFAGIKVKKILLKKFEEE